MISRAWRKRFVAAISTANTKNYERETIRQSNASAARTSDHPRATGERTKLQRLAPGSGHADAHEQSRSRGRRKSGSTHRLRRDGSGRAKLGSVRCHRALPAESRE